MKNYDVISVAEDVPTKQYVDNADALKVNKAGDTMTGDLVRDSTSGMTLGKIFTGKAYWGLASRSDASGTVPQILLGDVANTSQNALLVAGTGGSVFIRPNGSSAGDVSFAQALVTFKQPVALPANPASALHACTKQYADNIVTVTAGVTPTGSEIWIDTAEPDPTEVLLERIVSLEARVAELERRS